MKPSADNFDKVVREGRALTETYLDGAGIFAYRANKSNTAYEVVPIPWADRVDDSCTEPRTKSTT